MRLFVDVTRDPSDPKFAQLDEMESFFLAETIKCVLFGFPLIDYC